MQALGLPGMQQCMAHCFEYLCHESEVWDSENGEKKKQYIWCVWRPNCHATSVEMTDTYLEKKHQLIFTKTTPACFQKHYFYFQQIKIIIMFWKHIDLFCFEHKDLMNWIKLEICFAKWTDFFTLLGKG